MTAKAFDFGEAKDPELACRLANLISQGIARVEQVTLGTQSKQERFPVPTKANYAIHIVNEAHSRGTTKRILEALPEQEAARDAYNRDPTKQGRPLVAFFHESGAAGTTTQKTNKRQTATQTTGYERQGDDLPTETTMDIDQIVREVTDEAAKQEPPKAPKPVESQPDAAAALQTLLSALSPKAQVDMDIVRELVIQEIAKAGQPRPVQVLVKDSTAAQPRDLGVQHKAFPDLLAIVQVRNPSGYAYPVWLPGPAGSGKTTAARHVANVLNIPFHFTGAVDNVYSLLGFRDAGGHYHRTSFREAYEGGGVFLWDEVDASNPAALVAFNAAIENGVCAFPDGLVTMHKDCIIIAAANTYGTGATHEYVGRTKLDAATVDRYIMLDWHYDEALERAIAGDTDFTRYVQRVREATRKAGVKHVVSPRASMRGNALLQAGLKRNAVEDMVIWKGLSEDSRKSIQSKM